MSTKKDNRILGIQRDKLIVGLTMGDAVAAINLALRVRKAAFIIRFDEDFLARCYLEMPGVKPEGVFVVNPRTKVCYGSAPKHPDIEALVGDLHERLAKLEAGIILTAEKPPNAKPEAKLQLRVGGARQVALTLMDCKKGFSKRDHQFKLPDGTIP